MMGIDPTVACRIARSTVAAICLFETNQESDESEGSGAAGMDLRKPSTSHYLTQGT